MKTALSQLRNFIRHWWVILIFAVIVLVSGIAVFAWPVQSYMDVAILLPTLMLISGFVDLWTAFSERIIRARIWLAATGVIECLFGILLFCFIGHPTFMYSYFLGFWLLLRGMGQIGIVSELNTFGISKMEWTFLTTILLVLSALVVLFGPLFGIKSITTWEGAALMMAGISLLAYSLDLFLIRKKCKEAFEN